MQTFVLEAETRPENVTPAVLRTRKQIPTVFYGKGVENMHLTLPYKAFAAVYKKAGETNLVDLQIDGGKKTMKVLVHMVQLHPVSDDFIHVDLINVRMDQKLTTHVPVKLVGIAPAVKDFSGSVSLQMQEVEVRCLPADLIHEITIDVSSLKTLHDVIHVEDLQIPSTVEVLSDKQRTIVSVLAPKKEEEASTSAPVTLVNGEPPAPTVVAFDPAKKEGKREEKKEKKEDKK
ncbi:MAG: 50S ribosomal protein L25 [Patescibacteria group bacterium]